MTLTVDAALAVVMQSCLRDLLSDPTARLLDLDAEPLDEHGCSGNRLVRVRFRWNSIRAGAGSATWVVKRWLPGGLSELLLGVALPLEVVGWEAGLLRPTALPPGLSVPIVGAWQDKAGPGAWIVTEDVSDALDRYSRQAPLQPAEAEVRVRLVLDRLARLHSWWERPEQQVRLRACPWLIPTERFLWCEAANCAAVLRRLPRSWTAPGSQVAEEYRADVATLLAWLPASDRAMLERLLWDRAPLVAVLGASPRTLIHGDLDDRNLGLRPAAAQTACDESNAAQSDLVLIDWEWMGLGTPALDVARVWATFPAVCDRAQPCPDAAFSGELLDYYLDRYQAYGGRQIDPRSWRRECALAMLAHALSQVRFIGSVLRDDPFHVLPTLERQLGLVLEAARSLPIA
jgi:hypothetical protein